MQKEIFTHGFNTREEGETMKYNNLSEVREAVNRIAEKKINHYFTDWTEYDKPKFNAQEAGTVYFLPRKCGCYLFTEKELASAETSLMLFEYYFTQEKADYYKISIDGLTVTRMKPETIRKTWKRFLEAQKNK